MASKNPFEIRLEALKMAKEMLDNQYQEQLGLAHASMEAWANAGKDYKEFFEQYTPKMYQPKEVIEQAQQFYKFISEK